MARRRKSRRRRTRRNPAGAMGAGMGSPLNLLPRGTMWWILGGGAAIGGYLWWRSRSSSALITPETAAAASAAYKPAQYSASYGAAERAAAAKKQSAQVTAGAAQAGGAISSALSKIGDLFSGTTYRVVAGPFGGKVCVDSNGKQADGSKCGLAPTAPSGLGGWRNGSLG